jgi:hypothetical protein
MFKVNSLKNFISKVLGFFIPKCAIILTGLLRDPEWGLIQVKSLKNFFSKVLGFFISKCAQEKTGLLRDPEWGLIQVKSQNFFQKFWDFLYPNVLSF